MHLFGTFGFLVFDRHEDDTHTHVTYKTTFVLKKFLPKKCLDPKQIWFKKEIGVQRYFESQNCFVSKKQLGNNKIFWVQIQVQKNCESKDNWMKKGG